MVCNCLKRLDSGFRRNDGKRYFWSFYEASKINCAECDKYTCDRLEGFFKIAPQAKTALDALR